MLTVDGSRLRQRRLLKSIERLKLDAVVVGHSKHVYYFTGYSPFWLHNAGFILFADGTSILIAAETRLNPDVAADQTTPVTVSHMATLRPDQPAAVAEKIVEALTARHAKNVAIDSSGPSAQCCLRFDGKMSSIDLELRQLRRRKDADELQLITKAAECCAAMYARAKQIMEPGIPEVTVFAELQRTAVLTAGEPLSDLLGNDFVCGRGGGPPRPGRHANAGELYILDLGPAYRGYFADACRTFSVDRKPTDVQMKAWQAVADGLKMAERMARPGVRCKELFTAINEHLQSKVGRPFTHHLGHGVGLDPHEAPFLNPHWDDVLMEGEVFTLEPGTYAPELGGGIRLENQYVVTADGIKSLLNFPLELV